MKRGKTRGTSPVKSRFDRLAAGWDSNPVRVRLADRVAACMRRRVPLEPGMRVLDYGSGTGLLALALRPYVGAVTAIDRSKGMLKVLSEKVRLGRISHVDVRFGDAEAGSLSEGGFDAVVSSMTLHHVRYVRRVLGRLAGALKPGGWLAVADLDAEDGTFHDDPVGIHHHGFDRQTMREHLRGAGLVRVTVVTAHRIERPDRDGRPRTYPVFLAIGRRPVRR